MVLPFSAKSIYYVLGVPFIQSITTHIVEILKKSSQNGPKASFMLSVSANLKQVRSKAEHSTCAEVS